MNMIYFSFFKLLVTLYIHIHENQIESRDDIFENIT
jgi:hypothetical protein